MDTLKSENVCILFTTEKLQMAKIETLRLETKTTANFSETRPRCSRQTEMFETESATNLTVA